MTTDLFHQQLVSPGVSYWWTHGHRDSSYTQQEAETIDGKINSENYF